MSDGRPASQVETLDVGPRGCLVASGRPLAPGAELRLVLRPRLAPAELAVRACVAWSSRAHAGLEFDGSDAERARPRDWFTRLLAAAPGLAELLPCAPEEVDLDAPIYLLAPPRLLDLVPSEVALLVRSEPGITVGEILARAALPGDAGARAVFGLLEKRAFSVERTNADNTSAWRARLVEAGYAPARSSSRGVVLARTSLATCAVRSALPPPPSQVATAPRSSRPDPVVALGVDAAPRRPSSAPATLLRGAEPSVRCAEAQASFEAARKAAARGLAAKAIPLLRQALVLAPRDREIAQLLGLLSVARREG